MLVFLLGLSLSMISTAQPTSHQVSATWWGEVLLPCVGSKNTQRVYWQKERTRTKLVNALCPRWETECNNNISPSYIGRSEFSSNGTQGNFSLLLRNISVDDEGTYLCVVMNSNKEEARMELVELRVEASYSRPMVRILPSRLPQDSEVVNLTCTSSGGYPESRLEWLDSTTNRSLGESWSHSSRDHHHLYNITSILRINTTSLSVTCRIINEWSDELGRSEVVYVAPGSRPTGIGLKHQAIGNSATVFPGSATAALFIFTVSIL